MTMILRAPLSQGLVLGIEIPLLKGQPLWWRSGGSCEPMTGRGSWKGDPQHQEDGRPWAEQGMEGERDTLAQGEPHRHGVLHKAPM